MPNIKRARALRQKQTWAEKLVWKWLRDRRFSEYKFRRGHPEGPYFLDFYCEEARLSIELDGGGHGQPEQQRHDHERTRYLAVLGIKEIRIWNSRLLEFEREIKSMLFKELQERAPHPLPDYTRPMNY
ncbi:MAG: endonuclease domain-containing protein [Verrucomicrobiales bacterium]